MKNTNFYEMKKRYWEYIKANKALITNYSEGIKFYMNLYMYTIGLDPENPPQEYINKYMDVLDIFDSIALPEDNNKASEVLDKILLDYFGINPFWNDLF